MTTAVDIETLQCEADGNKIEGVDSCGDQQDTKKF
jgi:hypothetical protein